MMTVICTLFEGHFHYGLAALSNSLYHHGYRGEIYAGYRGSIPQWAASATENPEVSWPDCHTFRVNGDLQIHFLPVTTTYHFTNYKADFMLQLLKGPAKEAESIAYFDPDIVIKCRWGFYENWISHGVAIVHDVISNDMPASHPTRKEWEKVIGLYEKTVTRKLSSYLNAGFCATSRADMEFLQVWSDITGLIIQHYNQDPTQFASFDRTSGFWNIDQDAFNITAMCCLSPICEMGPEAMDFIRGGWTMSHATGKVKPWKKKFILSALNGNPPSLADKEFWKNVTGLINIYSSAYAGMKQVSLSAASFAGRFFRRY